jgi:hypothetical protein
MAGGGTEAMRIHADQGVTVGTTHSSSPVPGTNGVLGLPNGSLYGICFRNSANTAWQPFINLSSSNFQVGNTAFNTFLYGGTSINLRIGASTHAQLTSNMLYVGSGDNTATPSSSTIRGPSGSGTDVNAPVLTVSSGFGTGAGTQGAVVIAAAQTGAAGNTVHTAREVARFFGDGGVAIGNTASPVPGTNGYLGLPNGSNNGIAFRNNTDTAWINTIQVNASNLTIGNSAWTPFIIGGSQINFRIGAATNHMQLASNSLLVGSGDFTAGAGAFTIQNARAGGTNIGGPTLSLIAGLGTGTGPSGKIDLSVSVPVASGTGQHTSAVALRLEYPSTNDDTAGWLLVNRAGVISLSRVTLGAADSGGVGKRALVVAN